MKWLKYRDGLIARTRHFVALVSQDPESFDWDVCLYGKQCFKDYGAGGQVNASGCEPTAEAASAYGELKLLQAEESWQAQRRVYATTYCNQGNVVATGRPVAHECRTIPPAALQAEMAGDYELAIELMRGTP
jgi:hypothetical protein